MKKKAQEKISRCNSKHIYWCQCSRVPLNIKKGSKSIDTGKVCLGCGGKIFQEEIDDEKRLIEK